VLSLAEVHQAIKSFILVAERLIDIQAADDGRRLAVGVRRFADNIGADCTRSEDPTYIGVHKTDVHLIEVNRGQRSWYPADGSGIQRFRMSASGEYLAYTTVKPPALRLNVYRFTTNETCEIELGPAYEIANNTDLQWRGDHLFFAGRVATWRERAEQCYSQLENGPVVVHSSDQPFSGWETLQRLKIEQCLLRYDIRRHELRQVSQAIPAWSWDVSNDGRYVRQQVDESLQTIYEKKPTPSILYRVRDVHKGLEITRSFDTPWPGQVVWSDNGKYVAWATRENAYFSAVDSWAPQRLCAGPANVLAVSGGGESVILNANSTVQLINVQTQDTQLLANRECGVDSQGDWRCLYWCADKLYLHHTAKSRWQHTIGVYDAHQRDFRRLFQTGNQCSFICLAKNAPSVFFAMEEQGGPPHIYVADINFDCIERVLRTNTSLPQILSRPELIEFRNADGEVLQGVWYPPTSGNDRPFPTIFILYQQFFEPRYNGFINLLTSLGIAVMTPSVGVRYGTRELWLNSVSAAANALIDKGLADPNRLGVHGESFGGYGVFTLLTQTSRFRGAVSIGAVANTIGFYTDSPRLGPRNILITERGQYKLGGTLWEKPLDFIMNSPIIWADRIETPLLLISGGNDHNVPAHHTAQMYFALRRLKKKVKWVHYVNGGHLQPLNSISDLQSFFAVIAEWWSELFQLSQAGSN
jgi:dipeptidyl aminopeptidase/acylaminoacyl peptidase